MIMLKTNSEALYHCSIEAFSNSNITSLYH